MSNENWHRLPSHATDFTCPECRGTIREMEGEGTIRFRCRVGHAFSMEALDAAQTQQMEEALWVALQTLQERAQMLDTMAGSDRRRGWERSAVAMEDRAAEVRVHAQRIRDVVSLMLR